MVGVFDFGFVLSAGDVAAEVDVHFLEFDDIFELGNFFIFGVDKSYKLLVFFFVGRNLLEKLLFDCLLS